jgi:hypothetical protein
MNSLFQIVSGFLGKVLVIMAKTKPVVPAMPKAESAFEFVSLKDAAYKQSMAGDAAESMLLSVSRFVRMNHPKWPHEKDEVVDDMLRDGYLLRFGETEKGQTREFGYVDGNFIDVSLLQTKPKHTEIISVAYATGLSNYDYRMIDNPDKKAVVQEYRAAAANYVSLNKGRLVKKLDEIDNPEKTKKRGDNKTFRKHWEDLFEKGEAKIRIAQKQGDPDADSAKYNRAVAAFWKEMNAK